MTVSVSAETALVLDVDAPVRRTGVVPRWVEVLLLALAIIAAPLAFVLGLAIYAVRAHKAKRH